MPLRYVITYGQYTSGAISVRISTPTTPIFMISVSLSSLMRVYIKVFGMSTVATSICSYGLAMHMGRTELVANVGELASSLDIKYLCLLPPTTVLHFRVPYLFYLKKLWDSRIVLLYYSFKYLLFRGMNVYLI